MRRWSEGKVGEGMMVSDGSRGVISTCDNDNNNIIIIIIINDNNNGNNTNVKIVNDYNVLLEK